MREDLLKAISHYVSYYVKSFKFSVEYIREKERTATPPRRCCCNVRILVLVYADFLDCFAPFYDSRLDRGILNLCNLLGFSVLTLNLDLSPVLSDS